MKSFLLLLFLPLASLPLLGQTAPGPVKVYILGGQSNMVGQGEVSPVTSPGTIDYVIANDPDGPYGFVGTETGDYAIFEDVWTYFEHSANDLRTGDLSINFGNNPNEIGPELGFGQFIRGQHAEQVLIIKAAWGGRSLAVDFRPPSSGGTTGFFYNETLRVVNDALTNLGTHFPDYDPAQGYELAGFAWHQGFNDRINADFVAEYEENMANFIRDIRADLGAPFPFVIATTGMNGPTESNPTALALMQAQRNVPLQAEFVGSVFTVDTSSFWREPADSPSPGGGQDFHWNRNSLTYLDIGLAMAEQIVQLAPTRCPFTLRGEVDLSGVNLTWSHGSETPIAVEVLRNGNSLASGLPGTTTSYEDTTAGPGLHNYEVRFTMATTPCDPLTFTIDSCIRDLDGEFTTSGVVLNWINQSVYSGIEVSREGQVIEASLSGDATTFTDANAPSFGLVTYSVVPTNGTCSPTTVEINLNRSRISGPVLFSDTFDRPNSDDLNGSLDGKSGLLGTLSYSERGFGPSPIVDILGGTLRMNGPIGTISTGGLVFIGDHNFIDSEISEGGGFSISIDIDEFDSTGDTRQFGIGVGQSLANLSSQGNINPSSFAADLRVGYRGLSDDLEIYKNGTLDTSESIFDNLPDSPTTMRIEYLCDDFAAGSTVIYHVFFDDAPAALASGSFTWSGTNENYLSLSSSTNNNTLLDNLVIRHGESSSPATDYADWASSFPNAELSSPEGDFDNDGLSNNEERIWALDPTSPSSLNAISQNAIAIGTLEYSRRDPALTGLTYQVWTSENLVDWAQDFGAIQTPSVTDANGAQRVSVSLSVPLGSPRLFVRIQVP